MRWLSVLAFWSLASLVLAGDPAPRRDALPASAPQIVGHRGLLHHAPENTLAGFAACLDLKLGFELDVRRSKDGHLVCVHDSALQRTTDGRGPVSAHTLAELKKLDAGRWFDPAFAGTRVPALDEVFALLKARGSPETVVAIDQKVSDATIEEDMVALARKHGVLDRLVFIGLAIERPDVRKKLHKADPKAHVAVLTREDDFKDTLKAADADWVYIRFLPSAAQVKEAHDAGKKVFLLGSLVAGNEPENWKKARQAGVDALLTDYPLHCRRSWRGGR